jgi:hypothetical protein
VELYVLVLSRALRVREKEDPFTKFYWGSNEQIHVWGDIVREIGKILYAQNKVETAEPVSLPSLGVALASVAIPADKDISANTVYIVPLEPTPRPEPIVVLPLDGRPCNLP